MTGGEPFQFFRIAVVGRIAHLRRDAVQFQFQGRQGGGGIAGFLDHRSVKIEIHFLGRNPIRIPRAM